MDDSELRETAHFLTEHWAVGRHPAPMHVVYTALRKLNEMSMLRDREEARRIYHEKKFNHSVEQFLTRGNRIDPRVSPPRSEMTATEVKMRMEESWFKLGQRIDETVLDALVDPTYGKSPAMQALPGSRVLYGIDLAREDAKTFEGGGNVPLNLTYDEAPQPVTLPKAEGFTRL